MKTVNFFAYSNGFSKEFWEQDDELEFISLVGKNDNGVLYPLSVLEIVENVFKHDSRWVNILSDNNTLLNALLNLSVDERDKLEVFVHTVQWEEDKIEENTYRLGDNDYLVNYQPSGRGWTYGLLDPTLNWGDFKETLT